ncbi:VQ motif-containing protein 22-like [Zingiber officinale]|uniref:VQ domain-containing protein n=1 Tax=Zingiber officinale TaxID=94328 RepID=A0A8J5FQ98_ZINOF|nr:VQ motif-containing protein 22-like [Zingiber officinale]KAG6488561.1 hypothetical protein ZIOFF_049807 [Zingiber officinale]
MMSDTVSGQARPAHPDRQLAKGRGAADGQAGGRSVRRRTRASRRAPTTMFDTDAANFRAMVQQFTGLPSVPYATGGGGYNSYIPEPFLYNQPAQQRSFMSFGPSHSQEEQYQSYNSDHNIVTAMTAGGGYSNNNDAAVFLQGLAANYGTNFGEADGVFFRQAPTNSSAASILDHM